MGFFRSKKAPSNSPVVAYDLLPFQRDVPGTKSDWLVEALNVQCKDRFPDNPDVQWHISAIAIEPGTDLRPSILWIRAYAIPNEVGYDKFIFLTLDAPAGLEINATYVPCKGGYDMLCSKPNCISPVPRLISWS
jgi:hypothetical protein